MRFSRVTIAWLLSAFSQVGEERRGGGRKILSDDLVERRGLRRRREVVLPFALPLPLPLPLSLALAVRMVVVEVVRGREGARQRRAVHGQAQGAVGGRDAVRHVVVVLDVFAAVGGHGAR